MLDLKNKVALITGGASGIGLAYAKELLRQELKGVALVDINKKNGEKAVNEILEEFKRNDRVTFIKADISQEEQLKDAFEKTVQTFQQLDILFNNAGIIQEVIIENCINVNLVGLIKGTMLAIETYFPKYKTDSEGLIINTASVAAFKPCQFMPTYTATKFGVVGFTKAIGNDEIFKRCETKVIAICPGFVQTDMINVNENVIPEPSLTMYKNFFKDMPFLKPEEFARKIIPIIRDAPNGSIWIVTPTECNQVESPDIF